MAPANYPSPKLFAPRNLHRSDTPTRIPCSPKVSEFPRETSGDCRFRKPETPPGSPLKQPCFQVIVGFAYNRKTKRVPPAAAADGRRQQVGGGSILRQLQLETAAVGDVRLQEHPPVRCACSRRAGPAEA